MAVDKQFRAAATVAVNEIDAARRSGMSRRAAIRHVARRRRLPRSHWADLGELYTRIKEDTDGNAR